MKSVLVIGIGWEQFPLLERLFQIDNLKVFGIHYDNQYEKFPYEEILVTDFKNIDNILNFAKKVKPNGVISDQDDYAHFCQAAVSDLLNIPGPSLKQAQISINKYFQRLECKNKGINHPNFNLVASLRDVKKFSEKFGFPIIIKPIDNRGSIGVVKINNHSEIKSAFWESLRHSDSRQMIVEEYIEGQEVTVDGYCFNGNPKSLSVATKTKSKKQLQVSFDIKYPGELNKELFEKVKSYNEFVIKKLGYSFGMTHSEYIIDKKENIFLVEAANRGGGCFTSEIIVPNNSGYDLLSILINDVFSSTVVNVRKNKCSEVLLKFLNFDPGKIKSIKGIEVLDKSPNVLKYRIPFKIGDTIQKTTNDSNRHGFIILKSDKNIRDLFNTLNNQIKIEYYE